MSGFSSAWLALREAHDEAARSAPAATVLVADLSRHLGNKGRCVRILDLGSGTGSNLRHLAPRLGVDQTWTLLDKDGQLLSRVGQACKKWGKQRGWDVQSEGWTIALSKGVRQISVRLQSGDLRDLDGLELAQYDLVTGSALLDLVSQPWLEGLAARLTASGAAVYFALSVDGRLHWQPALRSDRQMAALFDQDLSRDKGFGPAAGVRAPRRLAGLLEDRGYTVSLAASDWTLGPTDMAMLGALTGFVSGAARLQAPWREAQIRAWHERRAGQIRRGMLRLVLGHQELLALM
ncbi:MAG: class I SAM-dependent methyltransferase [Alphaproteobacteria bacterium]